MRRKIKKQLAVLLILVMAVFCFTGCIRYRTTMTVKGNGTTDVSFLFAFEADGFSEIADSLNEITSEFEKDGWVIEPYSEDNYIGYIVTLRDVKLTDLEEKLNDSDPLTELGLGGFQLTIDGSYYQINWDSHVDSEVEELGGLDTLAEYDGFVEFVLVLPVEPSYYSLPSDVSEDGKTLTWDMLHYPDIDVGFRLVNTPSFRTTFDVKSNGTTDISIVYACGEDEYEDLRTQYEYLPEGLEDDDWSVSDYEEDGFIGCEFTIKDVELDKVEKKLNDDLFSYLGFDSLELTKKGMNYSLEWDTAEVKADVLNGREYEDDEYEGFMEVVVNLPGKAKNNNATDVSKDGKTLTWNLMEEENIELSFATSNIVLIVAIIGGVCLALIAAGVVILIIVLSKKKKSKKAAAPAEAQPAAPVNAQPSPAEPAPVNDYSKYMPPAAATAPATAPAEAPTTPVTPVAPAPVAAPAAASVSAPAEAPAAQAAPVVPAEPAAPAPEAPKAALVCPNCGYKPADVEVFKFCPECGSKVE